MNHTAKTIAKTFGAPVENVKAAYRRNAEQLRAMERKARETGKKQGGMTADYLAERAAHFEEKSQ